MHLKTSVTVCNSESVLGAKARRVKHWRAQSEWSLQALSERFRIRERVWKSEWSRTYWFPSFWSRPVCEKRWYCTLTPPPPPSLSCTLQALLGFHSPTLNERLCVARSRIGFLRANPPRERNWSQTGHPERLPCDPCDTCEGSPSSTPRFRTQIYVKYEMGITFEAITVPLKVTYGSSVSFYSSSSVCIKDYRLKKYIICNVN